MSYLTRVKYSRLRTQKTMVIPLGVPSNTTWSYHLIHETETGGIRAEKKDKTMPNAVDNVDELEHDGRGHTGAQRQA